MKPGWQTTEFWVTAATVIGGLLLAFLAPEKASSVADHADKVGGYATTAAVVAGGFAAGCYALARTLHKNKQ